MKRLAMVVLTAVLSCSILSGCYGRFALTKKVYQVNGQISDKFLRSGLMWAFLIFPVYEVCGLADVLVFNTIEFWGGRNPAAGGAAGSRYAAHIPGVDGPWSALPFAGGTTVAALTPAVQGGGK